MTYCFICAATTAGPHGFLHMSVWRNGPPAEGIRNAIHTCSVCYRRGIFNAVIHWINTGTLGAWHRECAETSWEIV